ncbi:HI0074 family nucleotidyltransferase substrate-binding subunit [Sansalvadorimonas verongulae]|uniref:HI0074 family nucleotidyltransferase substrate-binding subunit n=1 Tax=Sansalvadorimonas verongulae TaxID=2172824 RepID=UPI0018AD295A|nr:HI0074 family nucleotidyltransferase substrate-binding subunit [Sansalvadorimonas verongulae]
MEELTDPDSIYLDVTVKRFEFTFEMSWKAIKRVLAWRGIEANSPRSCFKEAYQQGYITNEQEWLAMIESRNLTAHTCDEMEARQLALRARQFHKAFAELYLALESQLEP